MVILKKFSGASLELWLIHFLLIDMFYPSALLLAQSKHLDSSHFVHCILDAGNDPCSIHLSIDSLPDSCLGRVTLPVSQGIWISIQRGARKHQIPSERCLENPSPTNRIPKCFKNPFPRPWVKDKRLIYIGLIQTYLGWPQAWSNYATDLKSYHIPYNFGGWLSQLINCHLHKSI